MALSSPFSPPDTSAPTFSGCLLSLLSLPACLASPMGALLYTKKRGFPSPWCVARTSHREPVSSSYSCRISPPGTEEHPLVPSLNFFGDFPWPLNTISEVPLIGHAHCPPCTSDSRPLHAPLCLRTFVQAPPVDENTLVWPTLTPPSEFPIGVSRRAHIWADAPKYPGILPQGQAHPELSWSIYSSAPFRL